MAEASNGAGAQSPTNGIAPSQNGASAPSPHGTSATPGNGATVRGPDGKFVSTAGKAPPVPGVPGEPPPGEGTPAEQERRFKRKLNVLGREEEADLSEEELWREVQMGRGMRAKLDQQLKALKAREREIVSLEERFSTDPRAIFEAKGMDPVDFAKSVLGEHAKRELMSPEERRAFEAEEKLAKLEALQKQHEEKQKSQLEQERSARLWEHVAPQFESAMAELSIPKTRTTLAEMAKVGMEFLDLGIPLEPRQVVAETKRRLQSGHDSYLDALDAKSLRERLGKERIREILRLEMEERKASQGITPSPVKEVPRGPPTPKEEAKRYLTDSELRAKLRR